MFVRFNLKTVYPFPCEHEVWHFQKWQSMVFQGKNHLKIFKEMVHLFKITIKIILYNFILHEIIKCDNRDPPWIDNSIRGLIQDNKAYKGFKVVIATVSIFKILNPFRVYREFQLKPLNHNSKHIILVYQRNSWIYPQVPEHIGQYLTWCEIGGIYLILLMIFTAQ